VFASYGLKTYIWNNRLKSILLLAGFPVLLLLISFAFALIIAAFDNPNVGEGIATAVRLLPTLVPVALAGALVWFVIAWFANVRIVAAATGAKPASRMMEPRVWNLLENLCISRGITMPRLRIIETDARNAFASGVSKNQYTVTVTRGLMNTLDDAELEAVLAHELTHIENRDVQLLVVAAVFVGVITLVSDILVRSPRAILWSAGGRGRRSGGRGRGGGGAIVLILIAVAIFLLARLLAIALRFAMSRKREYLADAGAVELTKNPDAMITALKRIAGHSEIEAPSQIQEMFLDHLKPPGFAGLFATHPSIEDRVAALVRYAGGHDLPLKPESARLAEPADPSALSAPSAPREPADPSAFGRRPGPPDPTAPHPWGETPPGPWDEPRS
jgi:heat shock protein HtpX